MLENPLTALGDTLRDDWHVVMDALVQGWLDDAPLQGYTWQELRRLEQDVARFVRLDVELADFVAWLTTGFLPEVLAGPLETEAFFSGEENATPPGPFDHRRASGVVRASSWAPAPPEGRASSPIHRVPRDPGNSNTGSTTTPEERLDEAAGAPAQDWPLPPESRRDAESRERTRSDEKNESQPASKPPQGLADLAAYLRATDATMPQPPETPSSGTPAQDGPPPLESHRDAGSRERTGSTPEKPLSAHRRGRPPAGSEATPHQPDTASTSADAYPDRRRDIPFIPLGRGSAPKTDFQRTTAPATDAPSETRTNSLPFPGAVQPPQPAPDTAPATKQAEQRETARNTPQAADSAWSPWTGLAAQDEMAAWIARIRSALSPPGTQQRLRPAQPERGATSHTTEGAPPPPEHPPRPSEPFTGTPSATALLQQPAGPGQTLQRDEHRAPPADMAQEAALEMTEVLEALTQEILAEYRRFYGA